MSVVSSYSVHSYTHLYPTQFSSCSHHCSNNCCQPNIHTPVLVFNSPISCMHRDEATSCTYIYFGLKPFSESPIWRDVGGSDTSPIQKHHSAPPTSPSSPPPHRSICPNASNEVVQCWMSTSNWYILYMLNWMLFYMFKIVCFTPIYMQARHFRQLTCVFK